MLPPALRGFAPIPYLYTTGRVVAGYRAPNLRVRGGRGVLAAAMAALAAALLTSSCGDDGTSPPTDVERPRFDGEAAQALIERQVAFGPRVPGREGHAAQLAWMVARLDSLADEVEPQAFRYEHSMADTVLDLTNVVARFRPESPRRILFLAHWDTRPFSDQADTFEERLLPVPGANDGGSGTAVLLQLAAHLAQAGLPEGRGVDLLLTDGEDFGPTLDDMLLGARHFAERADPVWEFAVLLDLVGDAAPRFPAERFSLQFAPDEVATVWAVAADLGYADAFPIDGGRFIQDDHIPLNEAGIPTVNIIDFDYGPDNGLWHTPDDTPDKTRASTLRMVGEVVLELVYGDAAW